MGKKDTGNKSWNRFIVRGELSVGSSRLVPGDGERAHRVNSPVCGVCLVVSGSGTLEYPDGRAYRFEAGSLILSEPADDHWRRLEKAVYEDRYLVMPLEVYMLLARMRLVSREQPVRSLVAPKTAEARFEELHHELECVPELELPRMLAKFLETVTGLLIPTTRETRHLSAMEEAAHLLERGDLPVSAIARKMLMSETNFRRAFQIFFHDSPVAYRIRKRLERVLPLLTPHGPPIKEAAIRCGWSDLFSFSRQFKKYYGVSPRSWRTGQGAFLRLPADTPNE